ncbi:hypothetical protein COCON_G00095320 [Conger conger]|uniref:CEP170 C-terminal domain-containing protein n=1 Tax=Conger conger TaxID=82655 RepID=A0A9Q1DLT7_CONCO|nr:hypothetical protein COCON_G00095320 [Conger conger]
MGLKPVERKRPDPPDGASDPLCSRQEKSDRRAATETPASRPTPLYGQPSWWGEDDAGNKGRHGEGRRPDEGHPESQKECSALDSEMDYRTSQGKALYSYGREPSYFEIPTKEFQARPASPDTEVQEIPTKDTDAPPLPSPSPAPTTPTPPVMQSHASFTIEFDDCTPGKMKIKDHVTKFSSRQHKPPGRLLATTPTEVMSAESKVADWLVHSDMGMMRKRVQCEDVCSTKSDLPVHIKTLKGHHHDDGTQSDSEDPVVKGKRSKSQQPELPPPSAPPPHKPVQSRALSPRQPTPPTPPALEEAPCRSPPGSASPPQSLGKPPAPELHSQQAFVIEFFDDNPRKKRSQSFTHTSAHAQADTYSALKAKLERRKGIPPTQQVTVPLKGQGHGGPQRASSLHREKADERATSSGVAVKPFGSLGKNSKLAREFAAEFLKETNKADPARDKTPSPSFPSPPASAPPTVSVDPKTSKAVRGEEEDSLSDAGTYTIETESQDKEVEEARNMIDQVFGVLDSPEYTGVTPSTYRPVIKERDERGSPRHAKLGSLGTKAATPQDSSASSLSGPPTGPLQVDPQCSAALGGPKWVSRWASLADSYSDSGPLTGISDNPPESADGDGKFVDQDMPGSNIEGPEFDGSQGLSRARRLLPQVPPSEKAESALPGILIQPDPYPGHQAPERGPGPLRQLEMGDKLPVHEDLDPDSLSDTSRSDDVPGARRRGRSRDQVTEGGAEQEARGLQEGAEEGVGPGVRSTSFYIGSEQAFPRRELARSPVLAQPEREQDVTQKTPPATAPAPTRHPVVLEPRKPLKPNASTPNLQSRDPTKEPSIIRQESFTKDRPSNDVQLNRLPHISSHPALLDLDPWGLDAETIPPLPRVRGPRLGHADDSLSGESDVDTASTISLVSSKNAPAAPAQPRKRPPASGSLKDKSSSSSHSFREQARQPTARERLSEKRRTQAADSTGKPDPVKRFQLRRSTGNRGSLDLSDHQQGWNSATTASSSDHESGSRPGSRRKAPAAAPALKDDGAKAASKSVVQQALIRSNSLSAPRPTRASLLRRARLGETSDNEGGETDRASQGSDVGAPGRPLADAKKLSRLDMLAMPRKRSGSFTAPSEPETAGGRATGPARKPAAAPEPKAGAVGRQPIVRARSSSAKYPSAATSQTAVSQKLVAASAPAPPKPTQRRTEQEEEPDQEADPYQHWSTHSAEIARLSQDLAKDLAILAREIHDVAGDGDSPSGSAVGTTSTSPSATANMPATNISTREEVILDNLMLNPVSQLSQAIRENTEQLAEKMKALFHNKTEVWEEIEAKINAENEVPILKTSNKEISSILKELRRVQKQLEVINTIIEPGANPELAARASSATGKSKTFTKDSRPFSQTRRVTGVSSSSPGNANGRAKGSTAGSEGDRFAA